MIFHGANPAGGHDVADQAELLARTTEIVVAHLRKNTVSVDQVPALINDIHQTLAGLGVEEPDLTPAIPIKRSVRKATIVCLECGKVAKMLKRHLSSAHGLGVNEYRARWGLPADYPMVAPDYAAARSALAKRIGLGRKPRKRGRKKG